MPQRVVDLDGTVDDVLVVLELANLQLEEFRWMDAALDRFLEQARRSGKRRQSGLGARPRCCAAPLVARRSSATGRRVTHRTTKFVGDWHIARVYLLAREAVSPGTVAGQRRAAVERTPASTPCSRRPLRSPHAGARGRHRDLLRHRSYHPVGEVTHRVTIRSLSPCAAVHNDGSRTPSSSAKSPCVSFSLTPASRDRTLAVAAQGPAKKTDFARDRGADPQGQVRSATPTAPTRTVCRSTRDMLKAKVIVRASRPTANSSSADAQRPEMRMPPKSEPLSAKEIAVWRSGSTTACREVGFSFKPTTYRALKPRKVASQRRTRPRHADRPPPRRVPHREQGDCTGALDDAAFARARHFDLIGLPGRLGTRSLPDR